MRQKSLIFILIQIYLTLFFLIPLSSFSQQDSIKVNFLYGSKPKWKYRKTESKVFGGLHGGHVTIQLGDKDYGFEPTGQPVHIFPHSKRKSQFTEIDLNGQTRYHQDSKTVTFVIPVNNEQYDRLTRITACYRDTTPFDYAFFGMRCASTTHQILAELGLLKKKKRFNLIATTFYPKKLRRRLFKLAERNNYRIIKTEGKPTRKWERD